jgi:hypothetical protein
MNMAGKSSVEISEEMEGFLNLTFLMADFIGENQLDGFCRWMNDNTKSNEPSMEVRQLRNALHAQMVISARLSGLSRSPLFRRF